MSDWDPTECPYLTGDHCRWESSLCPMVAETWNDESWCWYVDHNGVDPVTDANAQKADDARKSQLEDGV